MNARDLASRLDVSEATISRLCSGERRPSVELMGKIKTTLVWSLDSQAAALGAGTYGEQLRQRMEKKRIHRRRRILDKEASATVE